MKRILIFSLLLAIFSDSTAKIGKKFFTQWIKNKGPEQTDIVTSYYENGQNVNAQNEYGESLLSASVRYMELDNIKFLLTHNDIDKEIRDTEDKTPLIIACDTDRLLEEFKIEVVKLLLTNGCDVNAKDIHNNTALFYACDSEESDLVELLLENGASSATLSIDHPDINNLLYDPC